MPITPVLNKKLSKISSTNSINRISSANSLSNSTTTAMVIKEQSQRRRSLIDNSKNKFPQNITANNSIKSKTTNSPSTPSVAHTPMALSNYNYNPVHDSQNDLSTLNAPSQNQRIPNNTTNNNQNQNPKSILAHKSNDNDLHRSKAVKVKNGIFVRPFIYIGKKLKLSFKKFKRIFVVHRRNRSNKTFKSSSQKKQKPKKLARKKFQKSNTFTNNLKLKNKIQKNNEAENLIYYNNNMIAVKQAYGKNTMVSRSTTSSTRSSSSNYVIRSNSLSLLTGKYQRRQPPNLEILKEEQEEETILDITPILKQNKTLKNKYYEKKYKHILSQAGLAILPVQRHNFTSADKKHSYRKSSSSNNSGHSLLKAIVSNKSHSHSHSQSQLQHMDSIKSENEKTKNQKFLEPVIAKIISNSTAVNNEREFSSYSQLSQANIEMNNRFYENLNKKPDGGYINPKRDIIERYVNESSKELKIRANISANGDLYSAKNQTNSRVFTPRSRNVSYQDSIAPSIEITVKKTSDYAPTVPLKIVKKMDSIKETSKTDQLIPSASNKTNISLSSTALRLAGKSYRSSKNQREVSYETDGYETEEIETNKITSINQKLLDEQSKKEYELMCKYWASYLKKSVANRATLKLELLKKQEEEAKQKELYQMQLRQLQEEQENVVRKRLSTVQEESSRPNSRQVSADLQRRISVLSSMLGDFTTDGETDYSDSNTNSRSTSYDKTLSRSGSKLITPSTYTSYDSSFSDLTKSNSNSSDSTIDEAVSLHTISSGRESGYHIPQNRLQNSDEDLKKVSTNQNPSRTNSQLSRKSFIMNQIASAVSRNDTVIINPEHYGDSYKEQQRILNMVSISEELAPAKSSRSNSRTNSRSNSRSSSKSRSKSHIHSHTLSHPHSHSQTYSELQQKSMEPYQQTNQYYDAIGQQFDLHSLSSKTSGASSRANSIANIQPLNNNNVQMMLSRRYNSVNNMNGYYNNGYGGAQPIIQNIPQPIPVPMTLPVYYPSGYAPNGYTPYANSSNVAGNGNPGYQYQYAH
ncbi:uncharacterized protein ASCRUDRAFT_70562 [Ascoidea rubescens DSM 1968]|uniref:Uncharacterized protein n=1 Tax=Ascoidea rubescens DSM 1968 TaxID=1344418 RepID=A0A1D2VGA9_9ASCO|nr:hypothetical protein ASCRUDRAFT_70562 [Ascoidea rubescens DSM 1968]ODV60676.1 hypothetical protein ASCRUDRAFT_70562 [Ascoidea rubescens DSM 1968]